MSHQKRRLDGINVPRRLTGVASVASWAFAGAFGGLLLGAAVHEGAHLMIFNRLGCTSTITLPLRPGLWIAVHPECPAATKAVANRLTALAEVVGYHVYLSGGAIGMVLGGRHGIRRSRRTGEAA